MTDDSVYSEDESKFINFIKSYKAYYKPAYEIAKNDKGESILSSKKGRNSFKLYDLDNICQSCSTIFEDKFLKYYPKTTDALWYKKDEYGVFNIFLIEFKGDKLYKNTSKCLLKQFKDKLEEKLNNSNSYEKELIKGDVSIIKSVYEKYSDKMLNQLALKPLETVTIAIPLIYKHYSNGNKTIEPMDIVDFLRNSKIVYRLVAIGEDVESNNPLRDRGNAYRYSNVLIDNCNDINEDNVELTENYKVNLSTFHERYKKAGIIYDYDYLDTSGFNNFTNETLK